jgi:very-short-patch-repair endonuclease
MRVKSQRRSAGAGRHHDLAALADRQHGVVSIRHFLGPLGYSQSAISRAATDGRLHRLYTGVYAVGHTDLSLHGECLAAVLACGPRALLSHYSAAWLWGLARHSPAPFHVTGPSPRAGRSPVRLHRSGTLADADRALVDGIPVTSVARTLLDQAAAVDRRRLNRLLERSEELGLFELAEVDDVLSRNRGHHGARRLEIAVRNYRPPRFTRSEAERFLLEQIERAGLPMPATGFNLIGHEVDFCWPDLRLVVELDFFETHGTRAAFVRDRRRREDLPLAGYRVSTVIGERLETEPEREIERVVEVLRQRRAELAERGGV